jgi:hypothetical protein
MKERILTAVITIFCFSAHAQIIRDPNRIITKQLPVTPAPAPSVYTVSNIKVTINTGNDNKEQNAMFLLYINERNGIWGTGRNLFWPRDNGKYELKVNSETEIPMQLYTQTAADAFTLSNLEAKGLQFNLYYFPTFFADAWKIDAITIILEWKDQYGRLHPVSPYRTIRFNIPNGLLTNIKKNMTGITDGFFTPLNITITDK